MDPGRQASSHVCGTAVPARRPFESRRLFAQRLDGRSGKQDILGDLGTFVALPITGRTSIAALRRPRCAPTASTTSRSHLQAQRLTANHFLCNAKPNRTRHHLSSSKRARQTASGGARQRMMTTPGSDGHGDSSRPECELHEAVLRGDHIAVRSVLDAQLERQALSRRRRGACAARVEPCH